VQAQKAPENLMKKNDKCRICRKMGEKLFLKGDKCNLPTCPFTRKNYAPGQHGSKGIRRRRVSDYQMQLMEKQKAKAIYNINEVDLLSYYTRARKEKGATGQKLMDLLESRTDNVIYRASWATSRRDARQLVSHGLVKLNGKNNKSPNMILKKGDKLEIKEILTDVKRDIPKWIKVKNKSLEIVSNPEYDKDQSIINEQLIIEYYSR